MDISLDLIKKLIARNIPLDELKSGTIKRVYLDKRYDVSLGETNLLKRVKPCPSAVDKEFNVGDSVLLVIPGGNICDAEIWDRSNIAYPDEHIAEFSNEPEEIAGTIYLGCPNDNLIKVYSLDSTPGTDITTDRNGQYNIVTDGAYFYCASCYAYTLFKLKIDGSDEEEIVTQSRYYSTFGLAINPSGTYLYQFDVSNNSIARISIIEDIGNIEDTWKEVTEGTAIDAVTDLCGDSNYIYILANYDTVNGAIVKIYNFLGEFINEISVDAIAGYKITSDGTYLYISSGSEVAIYTIAGSLIRVIEGVV